MPSHLDIVVPVIIESNDSYLVEGVVLRKDKGRLVE